MLELSWNKVKNPSPQTPELKFLNHSQRTQIITQSSNSNTSKLFPFCGKIEFKIRWKEHKQTTVGRDYKQKPRFESRGWLWVNEIRPAQPRNWSAINTFLNHKGICLESESKLKPKAKSTVRIKFQFLRIRIK